VVVEDDDGVRRLICTVLEKGGYQVLEARSGVLAVSLVEATVGRIDVLLTDVVLPGLSGYELARWTRSLHPEARIVYMSGYREREELALVQADPGAVFIRKPFSPVDLLAAIWQVVGVHRGNAGGP
jgi:CheY-like chemotaxis protein